ncbi:hypothetical protein FQN54_006889 [Arachnomyces sp. PD_36]|nr:hypothetical protein FQN54_006889 [Arachnomyces sp. PD_36]
MATAQCPSLPYELWLQVLQNFKRDDDLPHLWMLRHVNRTFKDAVEFIFRKKHLPKTWVEFIFESSREDDELLYCIFAFSHLSQDSASANFCVEEVDSEGNEPTIFIYEFLQNYAANIKYIIEQTQHFVQIRRDVKDIPIPTISIGFDNPEDAKKLNRQDIPDNKDLKGLEKLELRCDWRETLARFYGEEMMRLKMDEAWGEKEKAGIGRGRVGRMKALERSLLSLSGNQRDGRKMARRARIRQQYKELKASGQEGVSGGEMDEEEESWRLNWLEDKLYLRCLWDFSDDEKDDEDEEESESSSIINEE